MAQDNEAEGERRSAHASQGRSSPSSDGGGDTGRDCSASTPASSATTPPAPTLTGVFDQVVRLIRETPVTPDLDTVTTEQKLRLYGLYKFVQDGSLSSVGEDGGAHVSAPSIFRVQAYAKYQAYKKVCDEGLTKERAMREYLTLAASQPNWLGAQCHALLSSLPKLEEADREMENTKPETMAKIESKPLQNSSRTREKDRSSFSLEAPNSWSLLTSRIASYMGLTPLVPRGQLDITVPDLAYAFFQCLSTSASSPNYRAIEGRIRKHCQSQLGAPLSQDGLERSVVVGLAVRSLLDMYLTSQSYPRGSQIILSPPISVPGMMHVFDHHGVNVVPVDLPSEGSITVEVEAVERAVTDRTVAIMIVHPFGMKSIEDWSALRALAAKHKIHLLEDAAETYTGDLRTTVSLEADVSFVSFGLIKTSTALGGGLAIVGNHELAQAMDRVQWGLYSSESWLDFLEKLFKSSLLLLLSKPLIYGTIAQICTSIGFDFDSLVTRFIRSFSNPATSQERLRLLRQRPTPALLALLHRRLVNPSSSVATRRVAQCRKLTENLQGIVPEAVAPFECERSTFWLYPILSEAPGRLRRDLLRLGIDSTQGLAQLQCIDDAACPRAKALMHKILYLPWTASDCEGFTHKLVRLLRQQNSELNSASTSVAFRRLNISHLLVLFIALLCATGVSLRSVFSVLCMVIVGTTFIATVTLAGGALVCWSIGDYYVEKSTCFARFSNLLSERLQEVSSGSCTPPKGFFPILDGDPQLQIPVLPKLDSSSVLLTGATGFIGSMILRDLLWHREALSIRRVILVCRTKHGVSGVERIRRLLQKQEFEFMSQEKLYSIIKVVEGDVAQPDIGLSVDDLASLRLDSVSHILHCAASVSFTQTLEDAARTNISPALALQRLAATLNQAPPVKFVHISTAFVHGKNSGSEKDPLKESLFSLADFDVGRLYSSMLGGRFYASKAMNDFGFHNTYTFSKCVCEHLLSRSADIGVETLVFRPAIVGPALENPHEGWAGSKPSTLVAAACLYLSYQWNLWSFGEQPVPCIPVDVVSRYVIRKAFEVNHSSPSKKPSGEDDEAYSSDGSFEKIENSIPCSARLSAETPSFRVMNVVWNTRSPSQSSFTWNDFAVAVTQLGSVLGFFSRATALLGLLVTTRILPNATLTASQYASLHWAFVVYPFSLLRKACNVLGIDWRGLRQLGSFLDLPLLFYPFMNASFHFESELVAPESLDGSRYAFICALAGASFVVRAHAKLSLQNNVIPALSNRGLSFMPVGGATYPSPASDLWWACTQPKGGFFVRFGAWLLAKVFRAICCEVTVDVPSFTAMASEVNKSRPARVVLAPTHRSLLDFLVLGYTVFSLPELQVELPMILAADDFEKLPIVGFLAKQMNAFFIRRGRKSFDPELIGRTECATCIEAFIEGSRSRDRRFLKPRTGFIRCLCQANGSSLIVPITVNYERLAEQSSFVDELERNRKSSMSLFGLIQWLVKIRKKAVWLGCVHISACEPILVTNSSKAACVANQIQARQTSRLFFSDYHVEAIASLLRIDRRLVTDELTQLGGWKWQTSETSRNRLRLSDNQTELVSILLQVAPLLARAVFVKHPVWSRWLHHGVGEGFVGSVTEIPAALSRLFDDADRVVASSFAILQEHGYSHPNETHVLQVAKEQGRTVPIVLLGASIEIRQNGGAPGPEHVVGKSEANAQRSLGFWGFEDSAFVVQTNATGDPFVTMKGSRYSLCGRRVTKLLPFIEMETNVKVDLSREFVQTNSSTLPICAISQTDVALLRSTVGEVSMSIEDRIRHGTGHSHRDVYLIRSGSPPRVPDAVVWPVDEAQVERLVSLAAAKSWCLIPFGGGTNVSHAVGCPPLEAEPRPILSVDLRRMTGVLWIDEENGIARVEAGILGRALASELASRGYTMGHEPDSIEFSTLGGWIATKSSGMKRSKYGNIEDIVKSVTVCGASGVAQHGNPDASTWGRESVGSNVQDLMFGSEGCLGVITSAVIRIWPLPEVTDHDGILFADFDTGCAFVREVSRRLEAQMPASLRLMDNAHFRLGQALAPEPDSCLQSCAQYLGKTAFQAAYGLDWTKVACATFTYEGDISSVQAQKKAVSAIAHAHGGVRLGSSAGKSGYEMTFMIAYLRDFALTYQFLGESFETFAPWSKVRTIVKETTDRIVREHASRRLPGKPFVGCRITQLYHEGACLYFYLCMSIENVPDPSRAFSEIENAAREEILERGGSLSHHHGLGKARHQYLEKIESPPLRSNLKAIKKALDPNNIFGARNGPFSE